MTTFLKVVIAAVALSARSKHHRRRLYDSGTGIRQACEDHDYTPHGVWDCR